MNSPTYIVSRPQFDRPDGKKASAPPEPFSAVCSMAREKLHELGCQNWDDSLVLFPAEWYDHIPNGFLVTDINGDVEPFQHGSTDNDRRFGCLAYGIRA